MDADERLTALKRAYADIILNTAKEAAARIMVSERKAVRFQKELSVTKEQALQMLLRLKQMMDSKVREAEMTYTSQQRKIEKLEGQVQNAEDTMSEAAVTSLSQQRKIEELEAQLHEAEDIVKDLREELREIQAELERMRKKKLQHSGERDTAPQSQTSQEEIELHNSQLLNQRGDMYECYKGKEYVANSLIGSPYFAFKSENVLDISQPVVFHPPESRHESFPTSDLEISAFNQRNEAYNFHRPGDLRMGNASFSKPDPSVVLRSKEPELYRNRRTQRIRAFEEKLMAGELSFSDDATYEASGREAEEAEGICKTPTYKDDNMQTTEKKSAVQADFSWHQVQKIRVSRRKRRRATIYKNTKTPSRYLSNQVVKRDQSSDTTENGIILKCTKVTGSDTEIVKSVRVENSVNKDQTSTDKLLLTELVGGSVENLVVPILRRDVEKVDVPVETKTYSILDGFSNRPVIDRVIKYTFQRKRKKESLSSAKADEERVLKKRTEENGPEQVEKSSSVTESSRDSRRLAQVARQLISLSEKKWWH